MLYPQSESNKGEILVVDDTLENLNLLSSLLSEEGYIVRQVVSGELALESVQNQPPDLILLDILMPNTNGYEVCKQLKENPDTTEIPVIFLSALNEIFDKLQAFAVGGADYITKPFHVAEVLARVKHQITLRQLQKQLATQNYQLQREIQERQNLRKKILESQIFFDNLVEQIPLAVSVQDIANNFRYILLNKACENIFGIPRQEMLGRNNYEIYSQEVADILDDKNLEVIKKHKLIEIPNQTFQTPTHGRVILRFLKVPLDDSQGQTTHLLSIIEDITERKRLESELQKANQQLQRLANLDGLTEIANRRRFDQYLQQQWEKLSSEKAFIALIMCDIDYFKPYNDTYGHQAGDHCLRQVASAISNTLKRPRDLVARYGGEEFAIILPYTNIEGAVKVGKKIQTEVQKLKLEHQKSHINQYVTLSLGITSTIPNQELSPAALIGVADFALYEAKKQGRNRIIYEDF